MHVLFKNQFETPKEAIDRYKASGLLAPAGVYTYVGRLDPLAYGVLPVLDNAELDQRGVILDMDKIYEVEVMFGVSTDTFDVLGIPFSHEDSLLWNTLIFDKDKDNKIKHLLDQIKDYIAHPQKDFNFDLSNLPGTITQYYPFFSSKPVSGVPLFEYTKKNGLASTNEVLPKKTVVLHKIEAISTRVVSVEEVYQSVLQATSSVSGDFRQDQIRSSWTTYIEQKFSKKSTGSFPSITFRLEVSSGFYARVFACWLGQMAGCGALALKIKRIGVGPYSESDILS